MPNHTKPTALKLLTGNPGHRPLNLDEPKPDAGEPEMPRGMSPLARKEWRSIVPELLKLGVLSKIDGKALGAYCEAYAMWVKAHAEVKKYGLTIPSKAITKSGEVVTTGYKRNPAVGIMNDALKIMKSYLGEFGLTPASRSRIKADKPAESDPFADYLNANKRTTA